MVKSPQPVQSMTGFARSADSAHGLSWLWELRSVNGRGRDVRFRLPPGFEHLELPAKKLVEESIARGHVQASLQIAGHEAASRPQLNHALLDDIAVIIKDIQEKTGAGPPSADGILSIRGILETADPAKSATSLSQSDPLLLSALKNALEELSNVRKSEGAALLKLLNGQLEVIENLVEKADRDESAQPDAIRSRLKEKMSALLEAGNTLDPQRLAAEAALLASRADIREEIDRLHEHVKAARTHLQKGGTIGRQLDFLAQEFNREANTLCAKAHSASITQTGLELKAIIDQFKEQVQNLQ